LCLLYARAEWGYVE